MTCINHPDRESTAFCQNCGKALCTECTRTVGATIFCEPCLAAKLAGAPGSYAYTNPTAYAVDGTPNPYSSAPNPSLAALLGFIPGVGAMYNGQYAKGAIHLAVFAVLVSLSNQSGIFGLFVAGWVFYQVIEAHHTARARRDGTPLPNPFGLNDIGERLGFGKTWPNAAATAAGTPPDPYATGTPPYSTPTTPWGAPGYAYAPPVPPNPGMPPVPPGAPVPPYGAPLYPDPNLVATGHRFPTGAVWLIGFGVFFLIANSHLFNGFPVHRLIPFLIIGVGVWLFFRKMTDSGAPLGDDGTPAYRFRLLRAMRGASWVVLVGILFLLDSFGILSWGHSWPLFIIFAGVMAFLQRAAAPSVAPYPYPYSYPAPPVPPATTPADSTSLTRTQHDQEGR